MAIDEELKQNLKRSETWFRLLYMILFAAIYVVAEFVLIAVVVIQFGFVLITGRRNQQLLDFGGSLSRFMYLIMLYVTFRRDDRPFPFADWPPPEEGPDYASFGRDDGEAGTVPEK